MNIESGSLVLYKNGPALVLRTGDKIEIRLADGTERRVRPKDVTVLHPGPVSGLARLEAEPVDLEEARELIRESPVGFRDYVELVFGVYTAPAAWSGWRLLEDGLYFSGDLERVTARSPEETTQLLARRDARAAAESSRQEALARLAEGRYEAEDEDLLRDMAARALGRADRNRILRELGLDDTPEKAHALLLRVGYWSETENPWPRRLDLPDGSPTLPLPPLPDEDRLDLTHLEAFAIDDEGNQDPDDAVSVDGDRLWVHVADVAALVSPDGPLDLEARARGATAYLPEVTLSMLPPAVAECLGLGLAPVSPALSIGMRLDEAGEVRDVEIRPSRVRVTRLTYAAADDCLADGPLADIRRLTARFRGRRLARGALELDLPEARIRVMDGEVVIRPLPRRLSRDLVTDAMLMAGEAVGRYARDRAIAIPYAVQPPPTETMPTDTLAGMFACRRYLQPTRLVTSPGLHAGLGLEVYTRATSPLRRYADLLVHQQLRAALADREPLPADRIMERVGAAEAAVVNVNRAERFSNQHWTLVFLQQNPEWTGTGVLVDIRGRQGTVLLPELAYETRLTLPGDLDPGAELALQIGRIDLPDLTARFRIVNG